MPEVKKVPQKSGRKAKVPVVETVKEVDPWKNFFEGIAETLEEAHIDNLIRQKNKYQSRMRWITVIAIIELLVIIFR